MPFDEETGEYIPDDESQEPGVPWQPRPHAPRAEVLMDDDPQQAGPEPAPMPTETPGEAGPMPDQPEQAPMPGEAPDQPEAIGMPGEAPPPPGFGPPGTPVDPRVAHYKGQVHGVSDPFQQALRNQLQFLENARQKALHDPAMYDHHGRPSAALQQYLGKLYHDAGNLVTHAHRGGPNGQNYLMGAGAQATQPQYTPAQRKRLAQIDAIERNVSDNPAFAEKDSQFFNDAKAIIAEERKKVGPPAGPPASQLPPDRGGGQIWTDARFPGRVFTYDQHGVPKELPDHNKVKPISMAEIHKHMEIMGTADPYEALRSIQGLMSGQHPGGQPATPQGGAQPAPQQGGGQSSATAMNAAVQGYMAQGAGPNEAFQLAQDDLRRGNPAQPGQAAPGYQPPKPLPPKQQQVVDKEAQAAEKWYIEHDLKMRQHFAKDLTGDKAGLVEGAVANLKKDTGIPEDLFDHMRQFYESKGAKIPDRWLTPGEKASRTGVQPTAAPVTPEQFFEKVAPAWQAKADKAGNEADKAAIGRMKELAEKYKDKTIAALTPTEKTEFLRGLFAARKYDPSVQIPSSVYVGADIPKPPAPQTGPGGGLPPSAPGPQSVSALSAGRIGLNPVAALSAVGIDEMLKGLGVK